MAQISYVKYTDVFEARRYDAEYFKPEYLKSEQVIKRREWDFLENQKECIRSFGAYDLCNYFEYKSKGIPFLRCKDIKNGFIDFSDVLYIDEEANKLLTKSEVLMNTVLFSMSGSVGNCAIAGEGLSFPINSNQDIAKISTKETLNPYLLTVFLMSKYGQNQIKRFPIGSIQQHIFLWQLDKFILPILSQSFQLQIEKIVKSAHLKQTQSEQLYCEAEKLLLTELGLLDYEVKHSLWFTTTKNEVSEAHRYDSEYFQPKYAEIIKKIENYEGGWDLVKNQFKQNTTLSKKDSEYCNYVEISDVNISNGEITPNIIKIKDIPANGKRKLFKNDLIISKVRPYRGAVSFIDFEVDNLIGSGAFTVLQEKTEYKKEVLMIFLKTIFIKELLLRYNCGTSYPVIKDEDILNLKIPLIKPEVQKQIAEKIQESHKLRKESKDLLEKAKWKVEEEIEK